MERRNGAWIGLDGGADKDRAAVDGGDDEDERDGSKRDTTQQGQGGDERGLTTVCGGPTTVKQTGGRERRS